MPSRREAFRFWLKLGFISFGGPAGQIAIMHREVVDARRWIDERSFMQALNVCMLLPGPEALQLAIWLGWRLHGTRGRRSSRASASSCPRWPSCSRSRSSTPCTATCRSWRRHSPG